VYAFLIHHKEAACDVTTLLFLCLFYLWPRAGESIFTAAEGIGARFAKKKGLAIISVAALVFLVRISLLGRNLVIY
jgi:hypothetical protein